MSRFWQDFTGRNIRPTDSGRTRLLCQEATFWARIMVLYSVFGITMLLLAVLLIAGVI